MEEKQKNKRYVLRKLFFASLYLSTFTFGGGYVIVTLLKEKFVDQYHWIDEEEMLDLVAIAQSSPGAIAVNGAIVVGYKLGGIPGFLKKKLLLRKIRQLQKRMNGCIASRADLRKNLPMSRKIDHMIVRYLNLD